MDNYEPIYSKFKTNERYGSPPQILLKEIALSLKDGLKTASEVAAGLFHDLLGHLAKNCLDPGDEVMAGLAGSPVGVPFN